MSNHHGFAQVPRLVIRGEKYKQLSGTAKWLYVCLKDICGDDGECYYSLRSLAELTGLPRSTMADLIPQLVKAELITAEKKPNKRGPENWHIRIVDIWEENDRLYRKQDNQESQLSQKRVKPDSHLSDNRTSLSDNRTSETEFTRGLSDIRTKEEDKKNHKGEGSPPPLVFPSKDTFPSEQLFPSEKGVTGPSPSDVPPDVQAVITNWCLARDLPVMSLPKADQAAAVEFAPLHPSVDDLRGVRGFCFTDNPKYFREIRKGKVTLRDCLNNWPDWKASQQQERQAASPAAEAIQRMNKPADKIAAIRAEFEASRRKKA